jgi:hypothetical protein
MTTIGRLSLQIQTVRYKSLPVTGRARRRHPESHIAHHPLTTVRGFQSSIDSSPLGLQFFDVGHTDSGDSLQARPKQFVPDLNTQASRRVTPLTHRRRIVGHRYPSRSLLNDQKIDAKVGAQ